MRDVNESGVPAIEGAASPCPGAHRPTAQARRGAAPWQVFVAVLLSLTSTMAGAEGIAPLAALEGSFRLLPQGDEVPPDARVGHSTISPLYDGVALEEDAWIPVGPESAFRIRHLVSWDPYRHRYRVAALDDGTGLLDIYEGDFLDGTLSVDNLASGTFFPGENGTWTAFRLRWSNIGEDGFEFEASTSTDGGASWARYVALRYERVQEP